MSRAAQGARPRSYRLEQVWRSRFAYTAREQTVLILLFVALFFAVFYQDLLLAALIGASLAALVVAEYYARFAGGQLAMTVRPMRRRVFTGQAVTIEITARNPQHLPVPWLVLLVHLPRLIEMPGVRLSQSPNDSVLALPTSLTAGGGTIRKVEASLPRRGLYRLGPVDALVSDPFGLEESLRVGRDTDSLLVYPRIRPLDADLRSRLPVGDRRGRSFLDEESHYLGPRRYLPTDPQRRIDWRQSARRGDLFVKTYENVATSATAIFLDPSTTRKAWEGTDTALLEETVEVTASLASDLIGQGHAVGLYVTGIFAEASGQRAFSFRAKPRTGRRQLALILEALAQLAPPGIFRALPRILDEEVPRLPYHVHVVVIVPHLTDDMGPALLRAARSHRVFLLETGSDVASSDRRLPRGVEVLRLVPR